MRDFGTLQTERLVLRPRRVEEAATYRRLWTERDPRVPAHRRIDSEGRPSLEDVAARIRAEQAGPGPGQGPDPGLLAVVRRDTGAVIGYCGLTPHGHGGAQEPELAFELLREVHGHGYATEAGRAVVERSREAGHDRLWAGVRDWNLASRRVLEKLGFRESGRVELDAVHGDSLITVLDL